MKQEGKLLLNKIQILFLLRIARACKTTSNAALYTLTDIPPVDLTVKTEVIIAQTLLLNQKNPDTNGENYQKKEHNHPPASSGKKRG